MFVPVLGVRMGTMNVFSSSLRGALSNNAPRNLPADEAGWLRAARRGDVRAYNQLVGRHQDRAYRVAFHLVQDTSAASNITQSVITHAMNALSEMEQESFELWLVRQITQRCAAFLQLYPMIPAPRTSIQRGMETLPFAERVTLVLADIENMAPQDIALITHTDNATVRLRIHRARCALRDVLLNAAA